MNGKRFSHLRGGCGNTLTILNYCDTSLPSYGIIVVEYHNIEPRHFKITLVIDLQ